MATKAVVAREKSSRVVEMASEFHAGKMAAGLAARLAPFLRDGETMPDLDLFADLLRRTLADRREALLAADEAHQKSLAAADGPRQRRDQLAKKVREVVFALRGSVDRFYPPGTAAQLFGIEGTTSRDPVVLLHQGEDMLKQLASPSFAFPARQLQGLSLEAAQLAEQLSGPVAELAAALEEVLRSQRASESSRLARRAAQVEHAAAVAEFAGIYSALFEAAGLPDLARTVRPAARRAARPDSEEAAPPADGPAVPPFPPPATGTAN